MWTIKYIHCPTFAHTAFTLGDLCILLFTPSYVMSHCPKLGRCEASWAVWRIKHIHYSTFSLTALTLGCVCKYCAVWILFIIQKDNVFSNGWCASLNTERLSESCLSTFHNSWWSYKYLHQTFKKKKKTNQTHFLNSISIPWHTRVNARWWFYHMFLHHSGTVRECPQVHH